jgi:hypothetical protein
MFSKQVRLCLFVIALVALGLTPAAQAGTRPAGRTAARAARAHAPEPGLLQILWRGVSQIFEKEGAGLDPHGITYSNPGGSGLHDEGSGIDPSGMTHG